MIKVILADDHHLVRQGIRTLLEQSSDIEVIAEAKNGHEAVELAERLRPDVLVMDIGMPRLNGVQAAERIRALELSTKVVILSMYSDETLIRQALSSGAWAYLLKHSVSTDLLLAIRAAQKNQVYLSPFVAQIVKGKAGMISETGAAAGGVEQLSSAEREVLQLLAEGYSHFNIAQAMNLSVETVGIHRDNLTAKLETPDLAGLIRIALKHGLIFLDV